VITDAERALSVSVLSAVCACVYVSCQ